MVKRKNNENLFAWNETISKMVDSGMSSGCGVCDGVDGCVGTPVAVGVKPEIDPVEGERTVLYDILGEDVCGKDCSDCELDKDVDACCKYQKERFSEIIPGRGFHQFLCYPVSEKPVEVDNYLCYVGNFGCELCNQYIVLFWDGVHWLRHKGSTEVVAPMFWGHLPPLPKGV